MESVTHHPLAGEPEQERGGAAMETEVPGIQPHGTPQAEAAARAADGAAVPAAGAGTDATDSGRESRTDGGGPGPLLAGLARLLREVRDAIGAGKLGTMDPATAAVGDLETVETRETEVRRATPPGRGRGTSRTNGW